MRGLSWQWVKEGGGAEKREKNDRCTRIKPSFTLHSVQAVAPLFVREKNRHSLSLSLSVLTDWTKILI